MSIMCETGLILCPCRYFGHHPLRHVIQVAVANCIMDSESLRFEFNVMKHKAELIASG